MGGNGRSFGFQVAMISLLGWFALWSCAPPSVVAPMVPLDKEKGWDLGLAASGGALITTNEPWDTGVEVGEHQTRTSGVWTSAAPWAASGPARMAALTSA